MFCNVLLRVAVLFNIFVNDLPLFLTERFLCSYSDDDSLLSIGRDLEFVKGVKKIFQDSDLFFLFNISWY